MKSSENSVVLGGHRIHFVPISRCMAEHSSVVYLASARLGRLLVTLLPGLLPRLIGGVPPFEFSNMKTPPTGHPLNRHKNTQVGMHSILRI